MTGDIRSEAQHCMLRISTVGLVVQQCMADYPDLIEGPISKLYNGGYQLMSHLWYPKFDYCKSGQNMLICSYTMRRIDIYSLTNQ